MGYLNNQVITVDAILTNKGRELLAKGDGSFKITQFALADDEIEQSFVPQVAERIPSTVTTLTMSGSFKGSINRNTIPKFLPNLTSLNFGGGGRRSRRSNYRGSDLRYDLSISLEEAYTGKKQDIKF